MRAGTATSSSAPRRVAVITGASAGIGRATAAFFAQRGRRVTLLARGLEGQLGLDGSVVFAAPAEIGRFIKDSCE